jgi:transposase
MAYQRVEVITGVGRRRSYSAAEKQRLVEEAFRPGVTVVDYARQQGLCASLLHRWRRQARQGPAEPLPAPLAATFVPIGLASELPAAPTCPPAPSRFGMMEIDLGRGRCIRVDRDVDADALRRVLQVLDAP